MNCPECGIEMRVIDSGYRVENDASADAETKLYVVQYLECRNKKCTAYKRRVEVAHEQKINQR